MAKIIVEYQSEEGIRSASWDNAPDSLATWLLKRMFGIEDKKD
jgi:hypothetical protein